MVDAQTLCKKIRQVFPDIGECGMEVNVAYDSQKKAYVVDLEKGAHKLKTYLEPEDADTCMAGRQCVGLSFQIAQLKSNIESL